VWRFVLLLVIVAVGSYYAARFLLEGLPRRERHDDEYVRPLGPDDDDEFLARISRKKGPGDQEHDQEH
jgi:hypothetical protein